MEHIAWKGRIKPGCKAEYQIVFDITDESGVSAEQAQRLNVLLEEF